MNRTALRDKVLLPSLLAYGGVLDAPSNNEWDDTRKQRQHQSTTGRGRRGSARVFHFLGGKYTKPKAWQGLAGSRPTHRAYRVQGIRACSFSTSSSSLLLLPCGHCLDLEYQRNARGSIAEKTHPLLSSLEFHLIRNPQLLYLWADCNPDRHTRYLITEITTA